MNPLHGILMRSLLALSFICNGPPFVCTEISRCERSCISLAVLILTVRQRCGEVGFVLPRVVGLQPLGGSLFSSRQGQPGERLLHFRASAKHTDSSRNLVTMLSEVQRASRGGAPWSEKRLSRDHVSASSPLSGLYLVPAATAFIRCSVTTSHKLADRLDTSSALAPACRAGP